jgi:hypothetical protein
MKPWDERKEIEMKAGSFPKFLRKGCYRNNIADESGIEVARIGLFALNDDSDPTIEAFRDEIVDAYNMNSPTNLLRRSVKVEVRNVFGKEMIYPANVPAEIFAAIAGKKTLSNADLMNIQALGFKVEEVAPKKLAA